MTGAQLSVEEIRCFERDVGLRLPFRFGAATLREAPQAFVRTHVRLADGREGWGMAAELMVPKWFDKEPALSNEQNFDQLRRALKLYAQSILSAGEDTAFGHHVALYRPHLEESRAAGLPALAAGFGPALIDRAVMDALCRMEGVAFAEAINANLPGINARLTPDLQGFDIDRFLGELRPSNAIAARHTVGLIDPLTADDVAEKDRRNDGLPETLAEVVQTYRHEWYKLKVSGDLTADIERLKAIAAVLDASGSAYRTTLDGNEQYGDVDAVAALLDAMEAAPGLEKLRASIAFLEQPIRRAAALERDVSPIAERLPVIIDESDSEIDSFLKARDRGYSGVSSKSCKGFYKSLLNLARCIHWRAEGRGDFFMSGEDLTCQAGLSVQQDLALVSLLGLGHVERNGHHFVDGMAGAPPDEQQRFLNAHPDLYGETGERVRLRITNGQIALGSLQQPGFGSAAAPDWSAMRMMTDNKEY
jgi:hypothetical protein